MLLGHLFRLQDVSSAETNAPRFAREMNHGSMMEKLLWKVIFAVLFALLAFLCQSAFCSMWIAMRERK
ncbi:hypothetical protein RvY_18948 [Ramazzottius varieornatus]|uniref:Uncharacterized protein n=1 Tax=Ramazzottius varieornatus TaxID=947166 RepID=A0A1D1W7M9_RAMVA|nr:hypothetical protein RvY_18948 [Ramazzottius varieornatus]